MRDRKIHVLKSWPANFAAIRNGWRTFDLRADDRDYQINDDIVFQEFNPITAGDKFTGAEQRCRITYVDRGEYTPGVRDGFACLGLIRYDAAPAQRPLLADAILEPQAKPAKRRKAAAP